MEFGLGIAVGLLISILAIVALLFFRRPIEHKSTIIERQVGNIGPRPRGQIFEPEEETDIARRQIIARNQAQGRDTHIDELL